MPVICIYKSFVWVVKNVLVIKNLVRLNSYVGRMYSQVVCLGSKKCLLFTKAQFIRRASAVQHLILE